MGVKGYCSHKNPAFRLQKKFIAFAQFAVGREAVRSSLEREVLGSNLGPVKLNAALPTVRHGCDIFSKEAALPGGNERKWAPQTSQTLRHIPASIMKELI